MIHKSGAHNKPDNYRPISIIPLLYKLFSKLLYARIQPILDDQQSKDQAGFRPRFSTVHHLFTVTMIQEKAAEWRRPVWAAALDFKKAFDSIEHDSIWAALERQGVPTCYINTLAKLYSKQTGKVRTDKMSKSFDIKRGTKQGDPLSSLLFNAVLEDVIRGLQPDWVRRKMGISLGFTDISHLCNLRFADDILLLSHSLGKLKIMLDEIARASLTRGLELHPVKTKILSNKQHRTGKERMPTASV